MIHGPNYNKEFNRDAIAERERSRSAIASRLNNTFPRAHKGLKITDRRVSIDAVTEVNDVPLSAAGGPTAASRFGDLIGRSCSQQFLIHVSLKYQIRVIPSGRGQVVPRSEANHVSAAGGHQVQIGTFFDEEDTWHSRGGAEYILVIFLRPESILLPVQHPRPGIKQLVHIRAILDQG